MAFIFLSQPKQQIVSKPLSKGCIVPRLPIYNDAMESFCLVVFLRHVGCPFAENMVKATKKWAEAHTNVEVVLISHGSQRATNSWLSSIGGKGRLKLIIDSERKIYGEWGLGYTNLVHFLGPKSLFSVIKLLFKGIKNRSASGTRFQKAAIFLIKNNVVTWQHIPKSAESIELPLAK